MVAIATVRTAIKASAIQTPGNDPTSHVVPIRQLKEGMEVAQRLRGDPNDSFVRVSELVALGLCRVVNVTLQSPLSSASIVAGLPDASNVGAGTRSWVTDATSVVFLATAVGGGANAVPVVSDGTKWVIG